MDDRFSPEVRKAMEEMKQQMLKMGEQLTDLGDEETGQNPAELALEDAGASDGVRELEGLLFAAFRLFDKNRDGYLTSDEIVEIMVRPSSRNPLPKADAEAFVKKYDQSKDGKLDLVEFSKVMAENARLRSFSGEFLVNDFAKDGFA